jgi:hypothetical protein
VDDPPLVRGGEAVGDCRPVFHRFGWSQNAG